MNAKKKPSDLTVEELADLKVPYDPRISRTGEQIVYTLKSSSRKGEYETSSLWLAEYGKESSARQLTSGQFHDRQPQWAPGSENIAFLSDRSKARKSCAIYILPLHGGEAYPVTPTENARIIASFRWSPNGKFIAFLSADEKSNEKKKREEDKDDAKVYGQDWEYARLRCLHVKTREIRTLVKGDFHVRDIVWSDDSDQVFYVTIQLPTLDSSYHGCKIEKVSIAEGQSSTVCTVPGPIRGPLHFDRSSPDGNEKREPIIFFLAGYTPQICSSSCALYAVNVKDRQWSRVAFGDSQDAVDLNSGPIDSRCLFVRVQDGLKDAIIRRHVSSCGETLEIAWEGLEEVSGFDGIDDKSRVAIIKSSVGKPHELFSLDDHHENTNAHRLTQLSNHSSQITALQLGKADPLYCKASDGETLDAIFFTPASSSDKPLPTTVLLHGGPYRRTTNCFNPHPWAWAPVLLSAGYAILCPNYRGGSSRGEAWSSAARSGVGTQDYDDVITTLNAAVDKGLVDGEKVVVGGWSQGGFLSYLCAVRADFPFKGAICGAGITDWDMMSMSSDLPLFQSELTGVAPWQMTDSTDVRARHSSAVWHMRRTEKKNRISLLILHGEEDRRVPLNQAVAFHRGCLEMDWPCEFVVYPREGHAIVERAHVIDEHTRVRRFCDLHLA